MGTVTCPFCSSADVERVAQWRGQIITAQWRCSACNSYFEAVRDDFDERPVPHGPTRSRRSADGDRHLIRERTVLE